MEEIKTEIAICKREDNYKSGKSTTMGCTSEIELSNGIYVCRKDFHLTPGSFPPPHHCEDKKIMCIVDILPEPKEQAECPPRDETSRNKQMPFDIIIRWWGECVPELKGYQIKELKKRLREMFMDLDKMIPEQNTRHTQDTKAECPEKPKIVCLCGSTRFYKQFQKANYVLTMEGKIVLSVGFYPHSSEQAHGEKIGITPEQKEMLDELHLRKIDLADEVFIINPDGYIGESTRKEYEYALKKGKLITSYEPIGTGTQTDKGGK